MLVTKAWTISDEDTLEKENILDGLRMVMAIKARAVLPYLVPQLVAPPVNLKALASIGPVAGDALHRHLVKIMPALIGALAKAAGMNSLWFHLEDTVLLISTLFIWTCTFPKI